MPHAVCARDHGKARVLCVVRGDELRIMSAALSALGEMAVAGGGLADGRAVM